MRQITVEYAGEDYASPLRITVREDGYYTALFPPEPDDRYWHSWAQIKIHFPREVIALVDTAFAALKEETDA